MKKNTCCECGKEYKVIGLDIFERCTECLDKLEDETPDTNKT